MNDIKDLPKDLPPTTNEFQIDVVGTTTNKRFLGEFVCKIPTIKDQVLISRHQAILNGEMAAFLEPGIIKVNKMISWLRFTLIDPYPKFWKDADLGYELRDTNVIEAVYDKVIEFEGKWLEQIWGPSGSGNSESKN